MADEEGRGKRKEILDADAAQYKEAVSAIENGDEKAKTKAAFF